MDVHVLNDLNLPVFPKICLVNRSVLGGIGYLYVEYQTDMGGGGMAFHVSVPFSWRPFCVDSGRTCSSTSECLVSRPRTMGMNWMAYGSGGEIQLVDVAWTEWHAHAHTLLATSKTGSFSENGPDH